MHEQCYTEPGFFKHGACFYRLWEGMNVKFLKTKRDKEKIIDSYLKTGWWHENNLGFIDYQIGLMEHIPGKFIDMDKLVGGDHEELKSALEYVGIEYNKSLTNLAIVKDLWRN